jgi:hypothetical protein
MRKRLAAVALLASCAALAQEQPGAALEKPQLVNTGSPMRVELRCTEEDISAAGLSCTAEAPCQVYLELSVVEPAGAKIFLAGNIHTASVTLHSILLASADAGKTWQEPYERIRGAALDQAQFFDDATGWIGGQTVQPLPRDPFLLLTSDSGATWRRRPVFEESRAGAVERFRFDSQSNGMLWIDRSQSGETSSRYERYESLTGGESWMLREAVNRPPPREPRGAERDTGWRLRPDEKTQSYRLERRGEGQWPAVAAFLIPIGECKPASVVVLGPVP